MRQMGLDFIGPLEHHVVVLNGRRVPYLTATPLNGGRVYLSLDDRFAIEMSLQDADYMVPFIAHCIAVSGGYTGHPDTADDLPIRSHPMPTVSSLNVG